MKDTVDQIYDELNAQVVRMLEHSLAQASRIAELETKLQEQDAMLGRRPCLNSRCMDMVSAQSRIAELESRIEFNGDHSQDGIVKRDERIADLERQLRNAKFAENLDAEDKAFFASLRAPSAPAVEQQPVPVELAGVHEQIKEGAGFWRSCSGCYETEDGHPVGSYPYSKVLECPLGNGCSECGGIGAIWDNNDYEEMARDWDVETAAPQAADTDKVREASAWEALRADVLHGVDGLDNDQVNTVLGMIDYYTPTVSMAAQVPVREVPEVNDAKYSEAEKAIGKIIFQRYPRIKGVHCASITIGILEYMGLRHSALNYDQQERVDE